MKVVFFVIKIKAFDKYNEYGIEPAEINIKQCIKYVARAWDNATWDTIKNCWLKVDTLPKNDEYEADIMDSIDSDIMDADTQIYYIHIEELGEVQAMIDKLWFWDPSNAEELIYCDNNEITTEMPSNEEIKSSSS